MENYGKKLLLAQLSIYMDDDEIEKAMSKLNMSYDELHQLQGVTDIRYLRQHKENV